MKRRDFLRRTAAVPLISLFPAGLSDIDRKIRKGLLEKRALGKTGEMLSMLGFGGIVVRDATPEQARNRIANALEYGCNYFDVAPAYGDAEIKMGPALEPYRDDVFLSCKTNKRTKEEAAFELNRSLERLRTDHFDLYQHHAVTELEDVETILGPGGAMEAFLEARDAGKVRFLGFSAHSVEAAMALMDGFDFDTIMFPISFASWHAGNFGPQVLERAKENEMGILALKAMAIRRYREGEERVEKAWYKAATTEEEAIRGLRFTLSHPVTAAMPPGNEDLFAMALDLALDFTPLSDSEVENIKTRAAELSDELLFEYEQA